MVIDPKKSLLDTVWEADSPDTINDAFCFVVGFTESAIRERIRELQEIDPKNSQIIVYGKRLDQLQAGWDAYLAATPVAEVAKTRKGEGTMQAFKATQASGRKSRK